MPFVDATPVATWIELARDAERATQRLEGSLGQVVVVAPGSRHVDRGAGRARERLEGMVDELERQAADPFAAERQVDDRVRPAAEVQHGADERLVHRHRALPKPGDPRAIAERLGERRSDDERDVLDGVVLVDLQVAIGGHGEVEQAVMGHRPEQVVEEPDPGVDRGGAGAVDPEGDRDRRLLRRAADRHAATVARPDLQIAEWCGHASISLARAWAASISRSFSSGSRTVSRRCDASGWPAPKVRGTSASAQEPFGDGGGAIRRPEVHEDEVRHRRARPTSPPRAARR